MLHAPIEYRYVGLKIKYLFRNPFKSKVHILYNTVHVCMDAYNSFKEVVKTALGGNDTRIVVSWQDRTTSTS